MLPGSVVVTLSLVEADLQMSGVFLDVGLIKKKKI